jgi:REP element-mobilizing transposase RayT
MNAPDFALLITWTCYGNWLPGDPRGYVSNTLTSGRYESKKNTPGTPYTADESETLKRARSLQKQSIVRLNGEQALVVAKTMVDACKKRGWFIARAAIMTNHVHTVIWDCPNDGSLVRRILKGTTQAALSDHAGQPRTWWTTGGSDRYKNDEQAIVNAVNYVANQERKLAEVIDMIAYASRGDKPRGS